MRSNNSKKIELSNVVHQIHELPQSEDIEIIGSPIKSSDIPEYNKEFKIDPNEMVFIDFI